MSDKESFLRAIEDQQGDSGLRLIYADWLEENGEEFRAQCLRRHVHVKHKRSYYGPRVSDKNWRTAAVRALATPALLEPIYATQSSYSRRRRTTLRFSGTQVITVRHSQSGTGGAVERDRHVFKALIQRGLVRDVVCTWSEFLLYGKQIRTEHPVQWWDINPAPKPYCLGSPNSETRAMWRLARPLENEAPAERFMIPAEVFDLMLEPALQPAGATFLREGGDLICTSKEEIPAGLDAVYACVRLLQNALAAYVRPRVQPVRNSHEYRERR